MDQNAGPTSEDVEMHSGIQRALAKIGRSMEDTEGIIFDSQHAELEATGREALAFVLTEAGVDANIPRGRIDTRIQELGEFHKLVAKTTDIDKCLIDFPYPFGFSKYTCEPAPTLDAIFGVIYREVGLTAVKAVMRHLKYFEQEWPIEFLAGVVVSSDS